MYLVTIGDSIGVRFGKRDQTSQEWLFYLPDAQSSTWDKLHLFMRAHTRIIDLAKNTARPYVFHLNALNRIEPVELMK